MHMGCMIMLVLNTRDGGRDRSAARSREHREVRQGHKEDTTWMCECLVVARIIPLLCLK